MVVDGHSDFWNGMMVCLMGFAYKIFDRYVGATQSGNVLAVIR